MNSGRIVSIVILTAAGNGNLFQYMVKVLGVGHGGCERAPCNR